MFEITREPIQPRAQDDDATGAQVVFTGIVRDHNEGKKVSDLEYEAMPGVAEKEGNRVTHEALHRFEVQQIHCAHRVGPLQIGDVAVQVTVTAAHRGAAFDACRYVIEEVKKRVPIWKRETYTDGTVEWVNAAQSEGEGIAVLLETREEFAGWTLIDVRPNDERAEDPIEGFPHLVSPKKQFDRGLLRNGETKTLLVCARGVSALLLADDLRREGHTNVWALTGGVCTLRQIAKKFP